MSDPSGFSDAHYPQVWDEFVGQPQAKRQLRIAAASARARVTSMDHVLISSPVAGIGKTSLALLTIRELGAQYRIHSGPLTTYQVPLLFSDLRDGDVLYLDEVHRLVQGGKARAEWLLHYLQDGVLFGPLGPERAPRVTIIASTTDKGRLPETILDRFGIAPSLTPYTDEEGGQIALQLSRKILTPVALPVPTAEVAGRIAIASCNSPRHMQRVLVALRDLALAGEVKPARGRYDLREALQFAGVTEDGLDADAQAYLLTLLKDFRGNPAGVRVLAERIGAVGGAMPEIERVLLNKGLIALTKAGRVMTSDGIRRAKELAA